ncbi:helix-turn-helix transcriptional regulator [Kineosporia babensis]|uniref:Helix-turn-helix transcriptional regulator n=1 Tax=Kineosporia babensis TaxID=499548 RepID=A0A9X1SY94_9ACTN|nr:helix-turn-helix transcriptional regulator [Kineosporia babensis]MCD5316644.1 helix-turn-helix transcriptional regulator [Kineosporia babensis]
MPDQQPRLAEFLRASRARLTPRQAGLDEAGRRRVTGLRREELAMLAGVSVDYYTRLEQGRSKSASPEVLDAIAGALQLDEVERSHLQAIARPRPRRGRPAKPQRLHRATVGLLDTFQAAHRPAFVLGRRLDVLGQNRLAALLVTDFSSLPVTERNQARFVFLDPHARELYSDWEQVAADTAAMLRSDAGRHADDPALAQLVGDLSISSPAFRQLWARNRVHERSTGTKRYHHPLVGDVEVSYQALTPADDTEQRLMVYGTEPGSRSAHALQLLISGISAATPQPVPQQLRDYGTGFPAPLPRGFD